MRRNSQIFILSSAVVFLAFGCGEPGQDQENNAGEESHIIRITKQQFASEDMETGRPELHFFADEVRCNGRIAAMANGAARVSAPLAGFVKEITCSAGDRVTKGETLCRISGSELTMLQQEFAITSIRLSRLKSEYERSRALYNEKIGAEKDFLAAESEYKTVKIAYQSLKHRLEQLNLDVAGIESGDLYKSYPVVSPINGYISGFSVVLGQFAEPQQVLFELVDVARLQLQLSVFERDVNKLQTGQQVWFRSAGDTAVRHEATLLSIGKTIAPGSGTIQCLAGISDNARTGLSDGAYVEAGISFNRKESMSLPSNAILRSGKDNYVYVVEKFEGQTYYLRKEKVNIGRVSGGFTEIVQREGLQNVLIRGVYNLPAE
jgi:cobalt-zinc-cadmium efflux system membrane fusion protein